MASNTSPPKTAVALYSVREPLAADAEATLRRLAELGFDHAEPFGIVEQAEALKAARQATGFTFLTAHSRLLGVDADAVFDAAASLGVRTVIEPYTDPDRWNRAEDIEAIADELNALLPTATARGLRLAYHNHWWETKSRIGDQTGLEYFAQRLDPAIDLEIDTYWAAAGGEEPGPLLRRLGDRVIALHIKDGSFEPDGSGQTPAGQGRVDVPDVLAAASQAQRIIEFDSFDGDIFQAVADSLAHLTEVDK